MTIPVSCSCGARLKIRDEAAGKTVKCPKCRAPLRVPEPEPAPEPEIRIVDEPAAPKTVSPGKGPSSVAGSRGPGMSRSPQFRAGLRSRDKVAWEVYVVGGLIALNLILNILQAAGGKGNIQGLGLNILMLVGLIKRTNWGWWLTVVLSVLGVGVCFFLASAIPGTDQATTLHAIGGFYVGVIALLIVCRVRGAYVT